VTRTEALWRDTFAAPASLIKEGQWIDRPSVSMAYLYLLTGSELSDALRSTGKTAESAKVSSTVLSVAHATGLDAVERQIQGPAPQEPTGDDSPGVSLRVKASDAPKTQTTAPAPRRPKP
jgi:hypothetical protein